MTDAENVDHRLVGSEIRVPFVDGDSIVDVLDDWGRAFFERELAELGSGYVAQVNHYPEEQMVGLECVRNGAHLA